jgi:hypothetical protein
LLGRAGTIAAFPSSRIQAHRIRTNNNTAMTAADTAAT